MKKPTYSKKKNKKGRATLISTTSDNICMEMTIAFLHIRFC